MSTIINGTTDAITFPDATIQNTSAIVGGKVPYANLPAGSVLQAVTANYSTPATTTSLGTMVSTGLTATITPKFATSKVLVLVQQNGVYRTGSIYSQMDMQLVRNSTTLCLLCVSAFWNGNAAGVTANYGTSASTVYLDSPATTSATTYGTQYQIPSSGAGTIGAQNGNSTSTITLLEIAA